MKRLALIMLYGGLFLVLAALLLPAEGEIKAVSGQAVRFLNAGCAQNCKSADPVRCKNSPICLKEGDCPASMEQRDGYENRDLTCTGPESVNFCNEVDWIECYDLRKCKQYPGQCQALAVHTTVYAWNDCVIIE